MPAGLQNVEQPLLQREIDLLGKLINGDILEQAGRILDHFTKGPHSEALQIPQILADGMLAKSTEFESVCDQIYYILEQSKRVLQLDWRQRTVQQEKQRQEQQQKEQQAHEKQSLRLDSDLSLGFPSDADDLMDTDTQQDRETQQPAVDLDEDEIEELQQIQRDRLDRLRKVVVLGLDAESVKDNTAMEDLLF